MFEIVHDESVKVYPHMYNGNVQQNPLCVESCVTKEFSMSPRFSSTIFNPDANSVLLRGHLCTAVDSMRKKNVFEIVQESGIEHIRRAEINKSFTEYNIKEVPNIVHAERIQRSPEMVF